jgi:hypothetical protein
MALSKHYGDYVVATAQEVRPSSSYNAASTTPTGFLEFKPRDMTTQRKYDAMSPAWEGIDSTNEAIARGDYSLDSAEATRQELREKTSPGQRPAATAPTKNVGQRFLEFVESQPKPEGLLPSVGTCVIQ